jgi:DNA polymerase
MRKQLKQIRSKWFACTRCALHKNRQRTVSHRFVGRPERCGLLLVGEAPGAEENRQGKPFVGRSGQLLDELLEEAGVTDATIVNVVACKPPMNRNPRYEEIKACASRMNRILHATKPNVIVTVGGVASDVYLLDGYTRGHAYWKELEGIQTLIVPVYHPAYLLRRSKNRALRSDMVRWLRYASESVQDDIPF